MSRINFSAGTKKLVAERAGLQCSFPTCNRLTVGPGASNHEVSRTGIVAHINSASIKGPRGQGKLTKEELEHSNNAIWLCSEHAKLVDNNRGDKFPPGLLLSFKQLQEARIAREHQGLYSPIGWFHEVKIKNSPVFKSGEHLTLAKLNLIVGNTATGKTAICEWIASIFDLKWLSRWRKPRSLLNVIITCFFPDEIKLALKLKNDDKIEFLINGNRSPLNPYRANIIYPRKDLRLLSDEEEKDDVVNISNSSLTVAGG